MDRFIIYRIDKIDSLNKFDRSLKASDNYNIPFQGKSLLYTYRRECSLSLYVCMHL